MKFNITGTVADPTFTPGADYPDPVGQYLSISCSTPNAIIYYTVNGLTPTIASPIYTGTFVYYSWQTVRAIAIKSGWENSSIKTFAYVVAPPVFSPVAGTFVRPPDVEVTITSATLGAVLHYTTNGTTPDQFSPVYSAPVTITSTQTLKAIAIAPDSRPDSEITTGVYTITQTVDTPTFSVPEGVYATYQTVSILSATGSIVYYTTDGSTPTISSTLYTGPITVDHTMILQAIATEIGMANSDVASATYAITKVAPVVAIPIGTSYGVAQWVSLSCATLGASIYYTTNGDEPYQTTADLYDESQTGSPIYIDATTTLKAYATAPLYTDSDVTTEVYTLSTSKPMNLSATTINSYQINLTWNYVSGDETGFEIQRQAPGESFVTIATVGIGVLNYSDLAANTGLDPNTLYTYRVKALRGIGDTDWSDVDTATSGTQGSAPADVTGFSVAHYTELYDTYGTWADQSANVPGGYIRIMHSVDNVTWVLDGNSTQLDGGFPWAGGRPVNPPYGVLYYYRVKAVDTGELSSTNWSATATYTGVNP